MYYPVFRHAVWALLMMALTMPILAFYAGIMSGLFGVPAVPFFELGLPCGEGQYQVPALCGNGSGQLVKDPCNWRQIRFSDSGHTDYLVSRCRTPQRYRDIINRAEACSRNGQLAGAVMLYTSAAEEAKLDRNPFIQAVAYAHLHELCHADAEQVAAGYMKEIIHLLPDLTDEEKTVVLSCITDRLAYELIVPLAKKFYGCSSRLHQYCVSNLARSEADLGNWQKASHLMASITRYHQGLHLSVLADCLFHSKRYGEAAWCYRRWKSFGWSLTAEQLADWRIAEQACGGHPTPVDIFPPAGEKKVAQRFVAESPCVEPQPSKKSLELDAHRASALLDWGELEMQLKLNTLGRGKIIEAARLIATIPKAEKSLAERCLSDLLRCIDQESDKGEARNLSYLFWAVSSCIDHMESVPWHGNGGGRSRWGSPTYNPREKIMKLRHELYISHHVDWKDAQFIRSLYQQYEEIGLRDSASRALQSAISLEQRQSRQDYGLMSRDAWMLVSLNLASRHAVETMFWFGFAEGAAARQSYVDYRRWVDSFDYFS